MAGCHLLDTADGSYNKAFIRKYFPKGGVKLVSCVGRQQGLMVAKGNPLQIRKFADIAKDGVRYVNRQKGSGTRILADYLCRRENVDTASVYGYDREELTTLLLLLRSPAAALMSVWASTPRQSSMIWTLSPSVLRSMTSLSLTMLGIPLWFRRFCTS